MRIKPSEAARSGPRTPQQPAASEPAAVPTMAADSLAVSAAAVALPVAGFSWRKAAKQWWTGFSKQPLMVLKTVRDHPWRAALIGAGGLSAILLVPVVLPISLTTLGTGLALGFGTWGAFNIAMGGLKAYQAYASGAYANAELAFERIGEGSFDLATAVAPYAARAAMKAIRGGVSTAEAVYAGRLASGAELVADKAQGLQLAAQGAAKAGQAAEASKLATAAKQLKTFERVLVQQSAALAEGQQSAAGARQAVQAATRAVNAGEVSPFRLANRAVQKTWWQRTTGKIAFWIESVRADRGVNHRAEAAGKAMKLRRFVKILRSLVSVVPTKPSQPTLPAPPKH